MTEYNEVQWLNSSSSGTRSWKLHGVTLVHLMDPEGEWETLCGRIPPHRRSKRLIPHDNDKRCTQCARRARIRGMVKVVPMKSY